MAQAEAVIKTIATFGSRSEQPATSAAGVQSPHLRILPHTSEDIDDTESKVFLKAMPQVSSEDLKVPQWAKQLSPEEITERSKRRIQRYSEVYSQLQQLITELGGNPENLL